MENPPLKFLITILFITFIYLVPAYAIDDVTSLKIVVTPSSAKIRPLETAEIQIQFFGQKKKSLLGTVLGAADESKTQQVQSNDWKISLTNTNGGWLSKPFLFQEKGERTKSGFENFIKQGLGSISSKDSVLYTAPARPGKYTIKITNKNLSEQVTIEVSNSAPSSKKAERVKFPASGKSSDPYFYLAAHYAPFIAQETWFTPNADFLARFDYDGNWKGDDNWENLDSGSSQAFVYYAAMETDTHWFLIYNFFHPRDYSDICIVGTCHENDNEGLILTVRKDGSKFGYPEVMETLAHNNVYSFTNDSKIKKGLHDIDGKLELFEKTHPIIFIEAGGHGVYGSDSKSPLFSADKMDFKDNTGITYIYKGMAERPTHANDRRVGYALLPIYDEWWSRGNQDSDRLKQNFRELFFL